MLWESQACYVITIAAILFQRKSWETSFSFSTFYFLRTEEMRIISSNDRKELCVCIYIHTQQDIEDRSNDLRADILIFFFFFFRFVFFLLNEKLKGKQYRQLLPRNSIFTENYSKRFISFGLFFLFHTIVFFHEEAYIYTDTNKHIHIFTSVYLSFFLPVKNGPCSARTWRSHRTRLATLEAERLVRRDNKKEKSGLSTGEEGILARDRSNSKRIGCGRREWKVVLKRLVVERVSRHAHGEGAHHARASAHMRG